MGETFQGLTASDPTNQQRRLSGEDGEVRVEYALVAAVLAAVAVGMLTIMDRGVQDVVEAVKLLF